MLIDGVENDDQLAHAGDEGDFGLFALGPQPLIVDLKDGVMAGGGGQGHAPACPASGRGQARSRRRRGRAAPARARPITGLRPHLHCCSPPNAPMGREERVRGPLGVEAFDPDAPTKFSSRADRLQAGGKLPLAGATRSVGHDNPE